MLEINKIYCADCLELMKDMEDNSVDMILCDLPYGTTQNKWDIVIPLKQLWEQYKRISKDNTGIILTSVQPFTTDLINSCRELFRYEIIWKKTHPTGFLNANRIPLICHENILIFYKKLPTYNPQKTRGVAYSKRNIENTTSKSYGAFTKRKQDTSNGDRYPLSVIEISAHNGRLWGNVSRDATQHPTQKPVALFEYLIKTYTNEGDLVLDNCIGSGTTAVACINTGRNFIGIEKDAEYFEIAQRRIKKAKEQTKLF